MKPNKKNITNTAEKNGGKIQSKTNCWSWTEGWYNHRTLVNVITKLGDFFLNLCGLGTKPRESTEIWLQLKIWIPTPLCQCILYMYSLEKIMNQFNWLITFPKNSTFNLILDFDLLLLLYFQNWFCSGFQHKFVVGIYKITVFILLIVLYTDYGRPERK